MNRIAHSLLVVAALTSSLGLGGCSSSNQSRQERAYAKYVRNSSYTNAKRALKMRPGKMDLPPMPVSEPVTTTETGPVAMASTEMSSE